MQGQSQSKQGLAANCNFASQLDHGLHAPRSEVRSDSSIQENLMQSINARDFTGRLNAPQSLQCSAISGHCLISISIDYNLRIAQ